MTNKVIFEYKPILILINPFELLQSFNYADMCLHFHHKQN